MEFSVRKSKYLKRTFKILVIIGIIVLAAHIISAVSLDKHIEYKAVPFYSPNIPVEMNGYKIAFISDTHALTAKELNEIVFKLNTLQPDLLILGGDFPSSDGAPERSMEILSKVITADGIYGVEGNHDHYIELFAAMAQYSIHPLSNTGVYIREHFYLAGVQDLWNRSPNVEKAIEGAKAEDFILLVTHNPDVTMMQNTASVDLILSGHTHGGHVTFFGVWAPALTLRKTITDYGQRFMSGWSTSRDGVSVYVSNGTGTFANVPRVFARPQVILITIYFEWSL